MEAENTQGTALVDASRKYGLFFKESGIFHADSEEKLKAGVTIDKTALPCTITPPGLSEERKQYRPKPQLISLPPHLPHLISLSPTHFYSPSTPPHPHLQIPSHKDG